MKSSGNPDHYTAIESFAIIVGDYSPVGDRMRRFTSGLAETISATRFVLIEAAQYHEVITYGEPSDSIGRGVLPRRMGPLFFIIVHNCTA